MPDMHHQIQIAAPPEKVFEALTTQAGLQSWWTSDTVTEPRPGGSAQFGFHNRSVIFRMHIQELTPSKKVVWECLGDDEAWKGTRLTWDLSADDGATVLHFAHANWRSGEGYFAVCNSTWGELMYRLKNYVEGRNPGPHWKEKE